MPTSSADIRQSFLSFFNKHEHRIVSSYPLVPPNDPTLLFTNAGMVQFKDLFTGHEKRDYTRATTAQKCVRAGGKHNDLENVGRTARHHTFFEMLGNFSFGDYSKQQAIHFAWDWVTKELKMDPARLYVTFFAGSEGLPADNEAERIWLEEIGLPRDQVLPGNKKDNFWQMGDTGPCGPCSELHYDRGLIKGCFGGDDPEGDRRVEIWNLVFMQHELLKGGKLKDLPAPSVDTGAGLERLAMVLNGHRSNYDTDLFAPLIARAADLSQKHYRSTDDADDVSLRVLADHSRAVAFLIADGVLPSNEGRGYVLRRIIRRAVRHGDRLGFNDLFFSDACDAAIELMAPVYSELQDSRALINKMVAQEEENFRRTLQRGLQRFDLAAKNMKQGDKLDGAVVHKLYEQDGFPTDLTEVLCRERGLGIEWSRFEEAKKAHSAASRGALGLQGIDTIYKSLRSDLGATEFLGYEDTQAESTVLAIVQNGERLEQASEGERVDLICAATPFYGESGGQVGDTGLISAEAMRFTVEKTLKFNDLIVHKGKIDQGQIKVKQSVNLHIDLDRRADIRANHTATHLLHYALREVLGDHVKQAGSLVEAGRLRFDFAHFQALNDKELRKVEALANREVLANSRVETEISSPEEAKKAGATALFGEKYGDKVRIVQVGQHSMELCGGTHVERSGEIGQIKIISEGPLASGVRRLEAVTRLRALEYVQKIEGEHKHHAHLLKVAVGDIAAQIEKRSARLREQEKALEAEHSRQTSQQAKALLDQVREVNGVKVLATIVKDVAAKGLRDYADKLRDQLGSGVVVLGAEHDGKASILVAVTKDLSTQVHAGKMVKELATMIDGRGGGRPDFAQAGGSAPDKLPAALEKSFSLLL